MWSKKFDQAADQSGFISLLCEEHFPRTNTYFTHSLGWILFEHPTRKWCFVCFRTFALLSQKYLGSERDEADDGLSKKLIRLIIFMFLFSTFTHILSNPMNCECLTNPEFSQNPTGRVAISEGIWPKRSCGDKARRTGILNFVLPFRPIHHFFFRPNISLEAIARRNFGYYSHFLFKICKSTTNSEPFGQTF